MVHAILKRLFCWFLAFVGAFYIAGPAHAAVAVLNNPNTSNSVSGSSTNTYSFTMSTGSNLALVALITYDTAETISTVVWDSGGTNQSMTAIPGTAVTNGACGSALYGLVGAITTGTHNLVVTFSVAASNSYVSAISFTGVNQTGGATSFPNGRTNTGTSSSPSSGAITSATGDQVVGDECSATASESAVGNTQVYANSSGASVNGFGNTAAGAATVTLTGTLTGSSVWSYSGTDIAQPAAAVNCGRSPSLHAGC